VSPGSGAPRDGVDGAAEPRGRGIIGQRVAKGLSDNTKRRRPGRVLRRRAHTVTYSDAEFEAMLADLESDLAERKETFNGEAPAKVREAICAFANDLPDHRRPGVVFVGVHDRGTPSHLAITDELLLKLADTKSDGNIVPPPTLTVAKRRLCGADVAVITVLPADSPPADPRMALPARGRQKRLG